MSDLFREALDDMGKKVLDDILGKMLTDLNLPRTCQGCGKRTETTRVRINLRSSAQVLLCHQCFEGMK